MNFITLALYFQLLWADVLFLQSRYEISGFKCETFIISLNTFFMCAFIETLFLSGILPLQILLG